MWDYIVVGAGPSGLSLAWYLSKYNKTVLVVDQNDSLGGCHRVTRVNGIFTEHGPRIYLSAYLVFRELLEDMGLNFNDLFTEYNFNISSIGGESISTMEVRELWAFTKGYLWLTFNPNYGRGISVLEFMIKNDFSEGTKEYVNRFCLMTDGATSTNYTLFEFLQLLNQKLFYKIYQPKLPNDIGLFAFWEKALIRTGRVKILLNTSVSKLQGGGNLINSLVTNRGTIYGRNFILAIPPKNITELLAASGPVADAFGPIDQLKKFSINNSYIDYLPIVYHWDKKLVLPKILGFPKSEWGVAFIELSNYIVFRENISKTVITTCITLADIPSSKTGKTANNSTKSELINEVHRQLKETFTNLPPPTFATLSPFVYRFGNKWVNKDTAYVLTPNNQFLEQQSNRYPNLYNVGTHNGYQKYYSTSFESAVSNSVALVNKIIPQSKDEIKIHEPFSMTKAINIMIGLIFGIIVLIVLYKAGYTL